MTNSIGPTDPSGFPQKLSALRRDTLPEDIANFLKEMEEEKLSPDQLETKTQSFKNELKDRLERMLIPKEELTIIQEFINKPNPHDLATLKKDVMICEIKIQVIDRSGNQDIRKLKMDILDTLENLDELYNNPDPMKRMQKFQVIFNQANNFNIISTNQSSTLDFEHAKDLLKKFNTNTPTDETPSQKDAEDSLSEALKLLMNLH